MSRAMVWIALTALAWPQVASAADSPRTLFGHEVNRPAELTPEQVQQRRDAFLNMLDEQDMVEAGDQVMPRWQFQAPNSGPLPTNAQGDWEEPPHYSTIFLNFFGGTMTSGTNAAAMESGCVNGTVDYPGYAGTEADALAIIQVFENAMAPYAVRIAFDEIPPSHLPYSMVMMGGSPQDIGVMGGALGVSCSSDCGDLWWRDTTFAFTEVSNNATTLGNTALQEAAHAFGLDHIAGPEHIMFPVATPGSKIWSQSCTAYDDSTGGIRCTMNHDIWCGGGAQCGEAELNAYFGPNAPDMEAPVVTILEPMDGAELDAPADVTIRAEVTDNHVGVGWRLRVTLEDGTEVTQDAIQFDTEWFLADLPTGAHTLAVEAIDHERNETIEEVQIFVGVAAPSTTGGVGETGGGMETGGSATDTAGMDGDGDGGGGKGCGCSTSTDPLWAVAPWMLIGLGAVRRRR